MAGLARRGVVTGLLALGGCGFRPLYAPDAGNTPGPASRGLASVYVPVMPERSGQLLRQALQQRLEGTGEGVQKQYELIASFGVAADSIGILRDSSVTRARLTGTADWFLRDLTPERNVVAQGTSRVLDGFNIANQQFFAVTLDSETAIRRIASSLADQIVIQVATYFQKQATPA